MAGKSDAARLGMHGDLVIPRVRIEPRNQRTDSIQPGVGMETLWSYRKHPLLVKSSIF
jgi:hypothetical protein